MEGIVLFILGIFAVCTYFQGRGNVTDYEGSWEKEEVSECLKGGGLGIYGFLNPMSCCGEESFLIGLDIQSHYKDCSTVPQDESEPFHMNYWRMYECLVTKTLTNDKKLDAYNYADMMTQNLSHDRRTQILSIVKQFTPPIDGGEQSSTTKTPVSSNMELIMKTYLYAKYQVCSNDSKSTFAEFVETPELSEVSLLQCRNHTFPSIPFFSSSLPVVQKCMEGEDESTVFQSLPSDKREIVCVLRLSGIINDEEWQNDNVTSRGIMIPKFYSTSVLTNIQSVAKNLPPTMDAVFNEGRSDEDQNIWGKFQSYVRGYVTFKNAVANVS